MNEGIKFAIGRTLCRLLGSGYFILTLKKKLPGVLPASFGVTVNFTLPPEGSATDISTLSAEKPFSSVSLLTGPEGGLEPREVEMAKDAGLHICTLGSRILRCETAPLCALSAVMYASGEF